MRLTETLAAMLLLACAPAPQERPPAPPVPRVDPAPTASPPVRVPPPEERVERLAPPAVAYAHGWMPLASSGADRFIREHPTYDGRGVLIAILDTGVDPGIPGLRSTSTGDPKLVDLRDFSGEGLVPLSPVSPRGDTVQIAGRMLLGFGRVVGLNTAGPYYAGVLMERSLGEPPASDLDGDGQASDTLALVVTRATDGWVLLADTDGDGSLAGERPVRDYLVGREIFGWAAGARAPTVNLAANFSERGGEPALDLVFALDAHGTHVAGIAAANDLYGVSGFDGVAPGAQLLGLKISNRANGSVSTSGAILSGMDYAIRYAAARRMPLVINLSFGVGNEREGEARIDQLVDSVLVAHPEVVLTVAAGNDGPGLSTVGFPGSARRAISVGGSVPSVFLPPDRGGAATDIVADFSARGGEMAKPDILAPGVAYSSVPLWNAGDEVKQGTSMAAPHGAGVAALLLSSLIQEKRQADARTIRQAVMVTARPAPHGGYLDEGRGLADVDAAYRWLSGGGKAQDIEISVMGRRTTGAWVVARPGEAVTGVQRFELRRPARVPPATYTLRSDVPWLTGPHAVTLSDQVTVVGLRYAGKRLAAPGAYTGVVSGWPADTLAGPGFRLVTTIVVPSGLADTAVTLWKTAPVEPGEAARAFFVADSGRPFEVRLSSSPGQRGIGYLHEPGGAPFREGGSRPLGLGAQGGIFRVDARDALRGEYQVAASAAPGGLLSLSGVVVPAPVAIATSRAGDTAIAELSNMTARPVTAGVELRLRGAQRQHSVRTHGAAIQRISFEIPAWASGLEVDLTMDRDQWSRFTDFGVTVLDSDGRQVAQEPMQYAFGRLSTVLPEGHGDIRADLALLPGFADPADDRPWAVTATIRLYADSAVAVAPLTANAGQLSIAAGRRAAMRFRLPSLPWPMSQGFAPLGVVLVREGEQVWTREGGFAERSGR
jgi:tripeptidyl-peptidase II